MLGRAQWLCMPLGQSIRDSSVNSLRACRDPRVLKAIRKGASVCYNQMQAHTRALHGSMASSLVLDSSKPPIVHVAEGLISQSASLSNDKQRTSSTAACKQAAQLLTQLSGARFRGAFVPCDCLCSCVVYMCAEAYRHALVDQRCLPLRG